MKSIIISDLHFGEKNNSAQHNQDLIDFFDYVSDWKNTNLKQCDQIVVSGDTFHQRDKLDVNTTNMALDAFYDHLDFSEIAMVKGNHDLYYKDRRDVASINIFASKVNIIDFYELFDDVMFCSWILNNKEYDDIIKISKKQKVGAIIGHFEFSKFAMNDHYIMEHGMTHRSLKHVERVVTGHYHMRQEQDNVVYVGTPFPFDYNDANDSERGFMVFDHDDFSYEWIDYNEISILSMNHKEFLSTEFPELNKTSMRIVIDESIENEDIEEINKRLEDMNLRDMKVVFKFNRFQNAIEIDSDTDVKIESIDRAIVNHLSKIKEKTIDSALLIDLFERVREKKDGC